ncbi:hypothetical protein LEP1GSC133_2480 [Leptospira borgpetersenii serovar Pomona str. 200901868]|uniref:Uncharacterized protein n=1 Tax=Leptospira borgpetersenii serovar Pomona str. 200901868 TaxID=1192866 RepID=M6W3F8_LEPBO|nr:hypothetical protein LEP1GSC133_2480 [Leptospira borgpetersenii serovar Pomona str. 200901868]
MAIYGFSNGFYRCNPLVGVPTFRRLRTDRGNAAPTEDSFGTSSNKLWESKPSKWSFFVKPNKHPWELFEKYLLKRKRTGIKRIPPNREKR